ncbi:MAG: hypothetical protein AB1641_16320 [Thermodesulfobacteriota bacterium]
MNEEQIIEPGQEWIVDLFRPEDAPGVTRLFKTVYGVGYPIKTFIEPDKLIEENAAGRTISSVARTPKGDVVGHNALFNSAPWTGIYESGAGAVHPEYRGGKHIFTRMVRHGVEEAPKIFPVAAIFGEPVCNHVFTQKMCHGQGWTSFALEVDLMPAAAYAQEKSAAGRVSTLLDFFTIEPRPHTVYLPPVYETSLRFIYQALDDERRLLTAEKTSPDRAGTVIKAQVFDFAQVARLTVWEAGSDFETELDREIQAVLSRGMVVIQVWVKLTWPWIGRVVEILRSRGFFLGGALPRWFDDDGLLMQKIIGRPCWEGIQLEYDRGRELMKLVKADWTGVSGC